MLSMDDRSGDELSALRRRAYGPYADIAGDAAALDRLRDLENQARASRSATTSTVEDAPSQSAGDPRPPEQQVTAAAGVDSPTALAQEPENEPSSRSLTPPRIGRALLIGWAASIVVVAVVVGALVFGLASMRPVVTDAGARQVAALQTPATGVKTGESMAFFAQAIGLYRYAGLIVAVFDRGVMDPDQTCLVVGPEASVAGDGEIRFASGCTAGTVRATATVTVSHKSPADLRDAFADGTALQFVWDGTAVGVFAADPPAPNAPA